MFHFLILNPVRLGNVDSFHASVFIYHLFCFFGTFISVGGPWCRITTSWLLNMEKRHSESLHLWDKNGNLRLCARYTVRFCGYFSLL